MTCLIAIDGGGTKTDAVLFTPQGQILARSHAPGCNPNDRGFPAACQALEQAISLLLPADPPALLGVFAGIAGASSGDSRQKFQRFLRELLPQAQAIACHCDAIPAMTGAIGRGDGCVVIAGTGSVAFARRGGELFRAGGWGYLLDKGGSGFDLGRDALYHALRAVDGRGPDTLLRALLEERFRKPLPEAVGEIYAGGRALIASLSPLVFQALREGDQAAEEIVAGNMGELAEVLDAAAGHLPEGEWPVGLVGGIFREIEVVGGYLRGKVRGRYRFFVPEMPPVYGAAVEAMAVAGMEMGEGFEEKFRQEAGYPRGQDA